jgi:hypothetical protein
VCDEGARVDVRVSVERQVCIVSAYGVCMVSAHVSKGVCDGGARVDVRVSVERQVQATSVEMQHVSGIFNQKNARIIMLGQLEREQ